MPLYSLPSRQTHLLINLARSTVHNVIIFVLFRFMIKRHVLPNVPAEIETSFTNSAGLGAKYPYLTAWLGFAIINTVVGFIQGGLVGLLLGDLASVLAEFVLDLVVGFFVFRFVVRHHVLKYVEFGKPHELKDEEGQYRGTAH